MASRALHVHVVPGVTASEQQKGEHGRGDQQANQINIGSHQLRGLDALSGTAEQARRFGPRLELRVGGGHMVTTIWQAIGGPAPLDQQTAAGNSPQLAKKSPRARILVADDEPLMRWSVVETLLDHGYDVREAKDAASAMRACSPGSSAVDVVFLDLRLPDCDDLRVLSAIRRLSPDTPVILMTAHGSPELFLEARRLGAFAIVDKPFEIDALAPLVERALAARPN